MRLAPTQGVCPPYELSQTSYDEALGLTVIDNIAVHCCRGLVKVCDAPLASGAGEAAREISRVFSADQKYQVTVQDDDAGCVFGKSPRMPTSTLCSPGSPRTASQ